MTSLKILKQVISMKDNGKKVVFVVDFKDIYVQVETKTN